MVCWECGSVGPQMCPHSIFLSFDIWFSRGGVSHLSGSGDTSGATRSTGGQPSSRVAGFKFQNLFLCPDDTDMWILKQSITAPWSDYDVRCGVTRPRCTMGHPGPGLNHHVALCRGMSLPALACDWSPRAAPGTGLAPHHEKTEAAGGDHGLHQELQK